MLFSFSLCFAHYISIRLVAASNEVKLNLIMVLVLKML